MEDDYSELIERLGVTMQLPPLREEELKSATYLLIRHGYSEYNYKDKMLALQYGEESEEFKSLKLDTSMMDPGLHAIGIRQCEVN